jgi:glycosyltransferase involved in cell wall biosynthesis
MKENKILSFVVPAYNEGKTLETLINKVIEVKLPEGFTKEILIVNDGSKDNTWEVIKSLEQREKTIRGLNNPQNMGKSPTVKNGLLNTKGQYVIIQDADLEYEPTEIPNLLKLMLDNDLDVVYGNRFGKDNKVIYWQNYIGNKLLSCISNIFTYPRLKVWIPDMEVCYKLVKGDIARDLAKGMTAKSMFGIEPEITAKLSKYKVDGKHLKFGIVPISYFPRSVAEGKKMKAVQDGLKALKEIITYNLK